MNIKILGPGCQKCKVLQDRTLEVIKENSFDASVTKVDDIVEIMNYNILATPAIVIDEKVVSKGSLLSKEEIKKLIEKSING